jgi:hypothetical protein
MNRLRLVPTLGGLLLLAAIGSCFGDRAYDVRIHNATDTTVTVVESNTADKAPPAKTLEPGATVASTWFIPTNPEDARRATVRATDRSGVTVFCKSYSFDEVRAGGRWQIDIVRDVKC